MVKARAAGYEVTIEEYIGKCKKHDVFKQRPIYSLKKNDYKLHIGNLGNLIDLHKKLKNLLNYGFIDNKTGDFILSYNSRYFYIKNKVTNAILGIPGEFVSKLSADIGKFMYNKMIQSGKIKNNDKNKQKASK